jgi:carbonic anhydrase
MVEKDEMNKSYERLLIGNKEWAAEKLQQNPDYFKNLSLGQNPGYLWIGCSDSRVPANEITGTKSGEIFVHRNIANVVVHTDMNLLSVLYYAVEVLHVKHVIVCGHYGCGGVIAAMNNADNGFVNNWLRNIKEVYNKYDKELNAIADPKQRENRLVELNVIEQVHNLAKTKIVQQAWKKRELKVHGWVYGFDDGLIKDLNVMVDEINDLEPIFRYDL